jgi:hypothetical protein
MISGSADYDICIIGQWPKAAGSLAEAYRTFLWMALNPNRIRNDLGLRVTSCSSAKPVMSTRIAVVGNGNNDVGNDTARKTGKPIVEQMKASGSSGAGTVKQMQAGQPQNCGAMSQQGSFSYHGNVSSPQQLLHLVGCRVPRVRSEPQVQAAPKRR